MDQRLCKKIAIHKSGCAILQETGQPKKILYVGEYASFCVEHKMEIKASRQRAKCSRSRVQKRPGGPKISRPTCSSDDLIKDWLGSGRILTRPPHRKLPPAEGSKHWKLGMVGLGGRWAPYGGTERLTGGRPKGCGLRSEMRMHARR